MKFLKEIDELMNMTLMFVGTITFPILLIIVIVAPVLYMLYGR